MMLASGARYFSSVSHSDVLRSPCEVDWLYALNGLVFSCVLDLFIWGMWYLY
jgi:hypothetical protein